MYQIYLTADSAKPAYTYKTWSGMNRRLCQLADLRSLRRVYLDNGVSRNIVHLDHHDPLKWRSTLLYWR